MSNQKWPPLRCFFCNKNRDLIFIRNSCNALNVIAVFVRNKDGPYFTDVKAFLPHAIFGFATGNSSIYQNSINIVTNVVAIAVTA